MKPTLNRGFHLLFIATLIAGLGLAAMPVTPAHADDTITVTSNADGTIAALNGNGTCDLREAIQAANNNATVNECVHNGTAGTDTINFAGNYTITLTGASGEDFNASGDLDIRDNLIINGTGAGLTIIDGGAIDRVFHVDPGGAGISVAISGVTVRNGNAGGVSPANLGGGIYNGGTLTLNSSTVSGNFANLGGGIYNGGTLTLNTSTVSGNAAGSGGGIINVGTLTLDSSTVSGNAAGSGGGIINVGTLTLDSSTVSDNTAITDDGGGIANGGTLTATNSTISGNTADDDGGGIYNEGTLTLNSSTVSGNTATTSAGGGIFNLLGTLTVQSSTVSGNTATTGGGIYSATGTLTLDSSTVSRNTATNLGGGIFNWGATTLRNTIVAAQAGGTDCAGVPITSNGYNLASDGTCNLTQATDQPNTNPNLGPLANNGGPTQTHALPLGSPAIDTGDPACPATDQRGVARPLDGDGDTVAACDSGAYEAPAILGIVKVFAPDLIGENGVSTLTFTITNPDAGTDLTGVAFTDNLPGGVVVAPLPNVANTCGVGSTVTAAAGTISLADGTLAAGGTCQVSVDVTNAAAGVYVNTSGAVTSDQITDGGTATDTLTVAAPPGGGGGAGGEVSEGTVGPGGLTLGDGCAKIIVEAGAYPVGSIVAFNSNPSPDDSKVFGDFRLDDVLYFKVSVKGPDGAPMSEFSPPLLVCAQACRGGEGTTLFDWDEAARMWRAWPTFVQDSWHCTDWYGNLAPPPPGDQTTSGDQTASGAASGGQASAGAGQTGVVEAPAAGPQVASAPSIGLPETGAPPGVSGLARIAFGVVIGLGMICGGVMLGRRAS